LNQSKKQKTNNKKTTSFFGKTPETFGKTSESFGKKYEIFGKFWTNHKGTKTLSFFVDKKLHFFNR